MTREELIEIFDERVGQYENFSHEVMDYINEKTDIITCNIEKSRNYYYKEKFKEIIKEMNGENHETAKRIMYVISKTQKNTINQCYYYMEKKEVSFLIDIGYSFNEILKETFLKLNRYISMPLSFDIMQLLHKNYPEEMEAYAENIFKRNLLDFKKINNSSEKNSVLEFYTEIICGAVLFEYDEKKYEKYKNLFIEYFKDAELNRELTVLLFMCSKYDESIFVRLKESILNDNSTSDILKWDCLKGTEYLKFLEENNIKTYPYYSLFVRGYGDEYKILKELFIKDKETFYETYEFAKKNTLEAPNTIYMLGIMLNHNEGKEILERDKSYFSVYVSEILRKKNKKINIFDLILNHKEKAEQYLDSSYFSYYYEPIRMFSVIYDFDKSAAEFIDFIMNNRKINYKYDLYSAVNEFLCSRNKWLDADKNKEVDKIIGKYIDIKDIFRMLCSLRYAKIFNQDFVSTYTKAHKKEALEFFNDEFIKGDIDRTLAWLEQVYYYADINNTDIIMDFLKNKSKKIRNFCEKYISENEDIFREKLEESMSRFKGDSLVIVKRIIKSWDNERKYGSDFKFDSFEQVIEFVNENYDEDNEKYTNWIEESYLENVRFKDSHEIVPAKVIRFIINEYMALSEVYRIKSCDKIIEMLNIEDFRKIISALFKLWLDNGSEAKKKNIGIPYCIYSSDSSILSLRKQLEDWAKASRGAVAAYITNAIALNGGKAALMMVEGISSKFPNAMVKKAAKNAFKYAAKVLEIPEDVLCDKIIPDLGFDRYGEKIIDYGNRTFKITLMEDFTVSIFDNEKNKAVKNLPKPNDKDDKFKAESAKKEFTALKKQIKAVVKNQQERLEQVFINGRTWSVSAWKELFIENPIMQMFARKMIWGVYDKGKLIESFRYMEDGTFNTADEEEYELPENIEISLVHPCELAEDIIDEWKQQLEDYEIEQPFEQINVQAVSLKDEDIDGKIVKRYSEKETTAAELIKIFNKYNLLRGEILDAGGFFCYHYIDKYLKIGVQINFEGMYVGIYEFDTVIELGDVIFYKIDEDFDDDPDDEIKENMIVEPKMLPVRFVSSIISIFDTLIS